MFSGMSKAVDSDAERAFFQSAQPSMSNYPDVNIELLTEMERNIKSLQEKSKKKLSEIQPDGSVVEKVTVSKDGKRFRLPKSQLEDALSQGYILAE